MLSSLLVVSIAAVASAGPLQDMINKAKPGDVVQVPPGVYAEQVTIRDGVMLISESGPEQTVIEPPGPACPYGVVFGKDAAIVGFTVRGSQHALYNPGNFIGVFECIITGFGQAGMTITKGSAAIMNNLISGQEAGTGIICLDANPYVAFNVIENNNVGFNASPFMIPTLDHNVFRNNKTAVNAAGGVEIVMTGNVFDGNGQNVVGTKPGDTDEVRAATAEELKLRRGMTAESYRALMKKVFEEAAAASARIMYDLTDELGKFNLIVTYPCATFSVSASARDTIIQAYDAYDRNTDASLNAQYCVANGGLPTVAVVNPQITDKACDRFVLEKNFVHLPSYNTTKDGRRAFNRLTNIPRIEVVLPKGWSAVEVNPGSRIEQRGDRQVVKLTSMGMTQVGIVLEPAASGP